MERRQTFCRKETKVAGITGVILAGGTSSRMGRNKALLTCHGGKFIEIIHERLASVFDEVLVVTNHPEEYGFLRCRMVPDIYPATGSFAGVHSGLVHSSTDHIFVSACDMPQLSEALIRRLCHEAPEFDAIVPTNPGGFLEPLHAVYGRRCIPEIAALLDAGRRSILDLFDKVRTKIFSADEVATINPDFSSFHNINTPEALDLFRLQGKAPGLQQK